jgi:uncharacterized repeat protein (TIGR01451 family)
MPTGKAFHKVLESVKTVLFAMGAVFLTCFVAWASGITVPENSRLNIDSGELHVETDNAPGSVTNRGIIRTTTGKIRLNGNWTTVGVGSYQPGTGAVIFSATTGTTQTITAGPLGPGGIVVDSFYDLTHESTSVLEIQSATNPLNITGTFRNLDGKFKANGMTMNVTRNWINTAPSAVGNLSFEHGNNAVNLIGGDQEIQGETTFYDLDKHLTSVQQQQLVFPSGKRQTIQHKLTLLGYDTTHFLALHKSAGIDAAQLRLELTGTSQNIRFVDVWDNDASGGRMLVARESPDHSDYATYHTTNWAFGGVTIKWDGAQDDHWDNPYNWNIGLVPEPGDIVIIPYDDEAPTPTPLPFQPVLNGNIIIGSLEIKPNATVTLDHYNVTVQSVLTNSGMIVLNGNESVVATTMNDTGVVKYVGLVGGTLSDVNIPGSFIIGGAPRNSYNALIVDETDPATPDTFKISSDVMVATTATFTAGTVSIMSGKLFKADGLTTVNGGTLNAQNGHLALNSFTISTGSLSAPAAAYSFTLSGNFTRSGGTFTPNDGKVSFVYDSFNPNTLLNQTILGNVGFFGLDKTMVLGDPVPQTLTFGAGDLVIVQHDLTLKGLDNPDYLNIASTDPGVTPGRIRLSIGALQDIQKVSVWDNDASGGSLPWGVALVARLSPDHSNPSYKTTNWVYGATTYRWDGTPLASATLPATEWNEPSNWDLGLVPGIDDTVIIRSEDETNGNAPIVNQPILSTNVSIADLTIRETNATLTLNGNNLQVQPGVFSHNGILYLKGNEILGLVQDIDSGTFVYQGDAAPTQYNLTTPNTFFNLEIQGAPSGPPSGTLFAFTDNVDMTIYGSLTMSGSSLDASAHSLDVRKNFVMTAGAFKAPGITKDFKLTGNFTQTTATGFDANGGTLTLNATSETDDTQQIIEGTTTFSGLSKTTPSATKVHRIIFDSLGQQTITRSLELTGFSQLHPLELKATVTNSPAKISLQLGGLQTIQFVDVRDSDASYASGIWLVARDSDDHSDFTTYKNTHWLFDIPTVRWTGTLSTDWNDPHNWDLGFVPVNSYMIGALTIPGDDVQIPNVPNQPHLTTPPGAVNLRNMTIEVDGNIYLDGFGMTVTGALSNQGTVILQGTEPVTIQTPDIDSGTFKYMGLDSVSPSTIQILDMTGTPYAPLTFFNLVIADTGSVLNTFQPNANLNVNGSLTINNGILDTSTSSLALTVAGNMRVSGGELDAAHGSIALTGSMLLDGGAVSAPDTGTDAARTFTVQGNWTNTSGMFSPNTGRVTFNGSNNITFSGNTPFWDLTVIGPPAGRTVFFQQGSNQTVANTLNMYGDNTHKLVLRSTVDSTPGGSSTDWMLTILSGTPLVNNLDVRDANAIFPVSNTTLKKYILAFNSIDQKNAAISTNTNWLFVMLDIVAPLSDRTVDSVPTIIGHGIPGEPLTLLDITGSVVATTIVDANGNFRVVVGQDDANLGIPIKPALDISAGTNDNQIVPVYNGYAGNPSTITVVATTTSSQVPVITWPANMERVGSQNPTITGEGKPGAHIVIVSYNPSGSMALTLPPDAYAGEGTVGLDGKFAITMTRPLMPGHNFVSVIVDGVSSKIMEYLINDVKGTVFDPITNQPIKDARVSLYNANGTLAVPGVDISNLDINPFITGSDGKFFFLTSAGPFKFGIDAVGYDYPTRLSDAEMPAGRSVTVGSRGELFTPGLAVVMDQPVDPNTFTFRVEKKANKAEARIGEVVTYTVTMESLLQSNVVYLTKMADVIPPGFKYMSGRAQFDGAPVEPEGNRPLLFDTGTFTAGQKKTIRYQLVVGSGVAPGNYENVATMRYTNNSILSNRATATVKIILDPLFDAGTIFGKVFYDWNENGRQDDPEYVAEDREEIIEGPVPNVRLVMEDGTVVTADVNGQFHIPALLPGRHLLRLDERSLPPGAYLTGDKVQVIDVTPGSIFKINFGVNMDNTQIVGKDAEFFQRSFSIDQATVQPKPRLNLNVFNDNILLHNQTVIEQIEFRIFTNYAPFLMSWQLDVLDADTKKIVRSFTGTRRNIYDPIYWDGRDALGQYVRPDFHYAYVLKVKDENDKWDETTEQALSLKVMTDEEMTERQRQRSDKEKIDEANARSKKYRTFLLALAQGNALKAQNIWVKGDTVVLKSTAADVRQVRVLKNGELFMEMPVLERAGLTARELLDGGSQQQSTPMEVILPDGDYELDVVSADSSAEGEGRPVLLAQKASGEALGTGVVPADGLSMIEPVTVQTAHYKRALKVGQDYLMFVAMGDGKAGYNMNRGNIEPVQSNETYKRGFYSEGKLAYYLKGKIKGKYLVTSSFDTERQRKEVLRTFRNEEYYPVYGDSSSVNYDATNTEGPLYLAVDWDKSQAIWGNYAVAFNNVEFANYTRSLYGGKLDYKTVASTDYGEPKTNVVVFHAEVRQRSAHNEFLGTGGSLYYFKHQDIVQGTDSIKLEVRDSVTGLVKSTAEMKEGVDYNMDYANGRILFWRPVSMSVDSDRLISNSLLGGDPVYVVANYEYFVHDKIAEGTQGVRVAQAVGKNLLVGGTYVSETQANRNYQLKGQDVTVHLGKNATVQAEYAETSSDAQNNYISTDGGITFSQLASADNATGRAYGIKQDARLFDRIGLKSYYKWIDDGFSTSGTTSQQGKELKGLAMTFDLTPVTRLTASRDVQRLIDRGNLQTAMQVGAKETTTTLVQVVHDARRLRLKEEFQSVEVKGADGVTTRNTNTLSAAAQAEYALNEKTDLLLRHEASLSGAATQATTVGIKRQITDKLSANLEETFSTDGTATKVGATANVTPKLAVNTDFTLAQTRAGQTAQTVALGGKGQINNNTSLEATTSVTQTSAGVDEKTLALGATSKVDDNTNVKLGVESTATADATKSRQALVLAGTKTGKEGRETTTGVKLEDRPVEGQTTVITAGEKGQINSMMQMASERSFAFGANGQEQADTYKIARTKDGRSVETSYARKFADTQSEHSDSNIFALSGDVNDRVALQASLEKGQALNLDGSIYNRIALSTGLGYVEKDLETSKVIFQSSTKAEVRLDQGVTDKQQYVIYQSAEGKINEQTTVRGKFSYSTTKNMSTKKAEAGYKEIMLGAAYRPIAMDRVNLFGEYTYKENKGPVGQVLASDVEQTKMHVLSVGGAYELSEKWELIEKLAMRIMEEKVTGFQFAKTHTWLLINRANYVLNQDWKIGAEYRILTVKEARDQKRGLLVEAVRSVNDNVELGIGYNFTNFVDDLTNLSYTVQGPFIRMTGKLYDQSPEERARARGKWLEHRVEIYAKRMLKKEIEDPNSRVMVEFNRMYQMAKAAQQHGKYEESREIYKNIITATQMMYEEAAQFVRHHIAYEEKIYNAYQRAQEYYAKGEFWQARKLWEKIVEEASKAVLE